MRNFEYKSNRNSQPWYALGSYDNKTSACIEASWVSSDYFMVKIIDTDVANIRERQRRERKEKLYSYSPKKS